MPQLTQTLAANVARTRAARHLSQRQLADAAHTTQATINAIENARSNPTLATLERIAAALGIQLAELFA